MYSQQSTYRRRTLWSGCSPQVFAADRWTPAAHCRRYTFRRSRTLERCMANRRPLFQGWKLYQGRMASCTECLEVEECFWIILISVILNFNKNYDKSYIKKKRKHNIWKFYALQFDILMHFILSVVQKKN